MLMPSAMSTIPTSIAAVPLRDAGRSSITRERFLFALVLCMAMRTSEALAGEWTPMNDLAPPPGGDKIRTSSARDVPAAKASELPAALDFTAPDVIEANTYSDTEFRPRQAHRPRQRRGFTGGERRAHVLHGTTVWQRLSDYRSHGRVRLLTLWETTGSTVSIQAGKGGNPTLQWTSRLMARGEATRGLLDRLWSVSLTGAGETFRNTIARSSGSQTPAKLTSAPAAVQPMH